MSLRTATRLGIFLFFLIPVDSCFAGEEEPIVWVAEGVSIRETKQIELYPVTDGTRGKSGFDVIDQITNTVRTELTRAGLGIHQPVKGQETGNIGIRISLVQYQPGNVGGRWAGLGGGAALCIIRANILDGASGKVISDIIVAEQVEGGGLFSIGAGKYVPTRAARKIAGELAGLFGIELKPGEVSE